jgi:hypothetical protein
MSQLFNNDVRTISQNTNHLGSLKCKEHVETLLEAGLHLQNTISQIKRLKKSMPGKLSKTTTMSFLPNNNCLATTENHLSTNNDSFIKRIQNQSLLRDFSISSLNQKEEKEKKKSACEQISIILKEAYPPVTQQVEQGPQKVHLEQHRSRRTGDDAPQDHQRSGEELGQQVHQQAQPQVQPVLLAERPVSRDPFSDS